MKKELLTTFNGKTVFITGHTGFKGAWLSTWLSELGANIIGYALRPEYDNSLFDKISLDKRITHIEGDIRNASLLKNVVTNAKPEFVFHLAAQALVRRSYDDPYGTFSTNVLGSVNLLDAVKDCPSVRSLVYITSDKCYLNKEWAWGYRENDELGGADPYSASKACAEHVFKSYFMSYFKDRELFGCASARAGNVIGGGDRSLDRIVPDIIRSIESNRPIILRSPNATRPWQHVLDPLYGYLKLATKLYQQSISSGESWNFGPFNHSIRTVLDLTKTMAPIWGDVKITVEDLPIKKHEANLLHLSIEKSQQYLNWSPQYDFNKAAQKTGEWYYKVQNKTCPLALTKEHINEFMGV